MRVATADGAELVVPIMPMPARFVLLLLTLAPDFAGAAGPPPLPDHKATHTDFFATASPITSGRMRLAMPVGTIRETFDAIPVLPGESIQIQLPAEAATGTLRLRWVVPDNAASHLYNLEIRAGDATLHRRQGRTRGFGRRSLFFPVGSKATASPTLVNRSVETLYVESADLVRGLDNVASGADDFSLALLINDAESSSSFAALAGLSVAPGIRKALSTEIYYAVRSPEVLRRQMQTIRERCRELGVSYLPAFCSWWAGTPPVIRERLDFQQVCWSDTDYFDEGPEFREFLGDAWNIHYGLTIPNKWSSTPWQTMNSPELNEFRHTRLSTAVELADSMLGDYAVGHIAENEPAYWAFDGSDEKYPVRRRDVTADYNPQTVGDAKADGVRLDPSNGLDLIERAWLQRNVARYNEAAVDAMQKARPRAPVYSHALLDYTHFPFADTNLAHSYAEAAHVRAARLGVEMLWGTDMDALWRTREWGPWGCVNREENDGMAMPFHLATLRACYMAGADHLNSYNWQAIAPEGVLPSYFEQFMQDIRNGGDVVVAESAGGTTWEPVGSWSGFVDPDESFPWFNQAELELRCPGPAGDLKVIAMREKEIIAYGSVSPGDVPASGSLRLNFGDLARPNQRDNVELILANGEGWEIRSGDKGPNYRLICNLQEERRRSRLAGGTVPAAVDVIPCTIEP